MVNMKMSREEATEQMEPKADDAPQYPWGLCLDLDDDALAKLGITGDLPPVGTQLSVQALVTVTRTGAYQTQGQEKESSLGLQITDMEIGPAPETSAAAKSLYSGG